MKYANFIQMKNCVVVIYTMAVYIRGFLAIANTTAINWQTVAGSQL